LSRARLPNAWGRSGKLNSGEARSTADPKKAGAVRATFAALELRPQIQSGRQSFFINFIISYVNRVPNPRRSSPNETLDTGFTDAIERLAAEFTSR
jgi:hypothetical protein